jgi:hypothetical protein
MKKNKAPVPFFFNFLLLFLSFSTLDKKKKKKTIKKYKWDRPPEPSSATPSSQFLPAVRDFGTIRRAVKFCVFFAKKILESGGKRRC